jgi:hypothetical protein
MRGFFHESFAQSFFVLAVKVKCFIGARILAQMRLKNVGEIDSRSENMFARKKGQTLSSIFRPTVTEGKVKLKIVKTLLAIM